MIFHRWQTPISDVKDLYFNRLLDKGQGTFEVKTKEGTLFEVILGEKTGPYLIVEEEHLTKYWSIIPKGTGNTFIVEESDFPLFFPGEMDPGDYKHYVVSTWSICIEVLSKVPPIVRKVL